MIIKEIFFTNTDIEFKLKKKKIVDLSIVTTITRNTQSPT